MGRELPKPGEKYLHFKNKLYQILCMAEHAETGEKMVVYQALYGTFACYTRPLEMFLGEVDHEKYPDVSQNYRFERMDDAKLQESGIEPEILQQTKTTEVEMTETEHMRQAKDAEAEAGHMRQTKATVAEVTETGYMQQNRNAEAEVLQQENAHTSQLSQENGEEEQADPVLLRFLDMDTLEEKYQLVKSMERSITHRLIDDFAVVLDLVIPEGSLSSRYHQLLSSIGTMQRFENSRFR